MLIIHGPPTTSPTSPFPSLFPKLGNVKVSDFPIYFDRAQRFQVFGQQLEMVKIQIFRIIWGTSAFPSFLAKPGNAEVGFFVSTLGDLSVSRFFGKTWKC